MRTGSYYISSYTLVTLGILAFFVKYYNVKYLIDKFQGRFVTRSLLLSDIAINLQCKRIYKSKRIFNKWGLNPAFR